MIRFITNYDSSTEYLKQHVVAVTAVVAVAIAALAVLAKVIYNYVQHRTIAFSDRNSTPIKALSNSLKKI